MTERPQTTQHPDPQLIPLSTPTFNTDPNKELKKSEILGQKWRKIVKLSLLEAKPTHRPPFFIPEIERSYENTKHI